MKRARSLLLVLLIGVPCLVAQAAQDTPEDGSKPPAATADDHSMSGMHHHHSEEPLDPARQAKLLADKKESEFNHHLAGFFTALGGIFILFQMAFGKKSLLKYIWPATFLLSGIFVLLWSDTELWPIGNRHWLETMQRDPEVLQHKVFAGLLLGLGIVEWLRVRETLKAVWSALVFPVLAIGGSILLLFHQHQAGMHGSDHMELMARIQSEHLSFSVTGIGIGLTKALSEVSLPGQKVFARVWPLLMVALGVLLMLYQE